MLIIDVGGADNGDFSIKHALDGVSLVYAIAPNPALISRLQARLLPNLQAFCLTLLGEEESTGAVPDSTQVILATKLDDFMEKHAITDVNLLRISAQDAVIEILKGAGSAIHKVQRIQIDPLLDDEAAVEVVAYLEASGFRVIGQYDGEQQQSKNLDFLRVCRYAKNQSSSDVFEVTVPYVGLLTMPKHDLVGRLLEQGLFEGPEQAFLWLYLRPGDTFFDCGAHAGIFSCIAAKNLQNQGQIFGFEPIENNASLCKKNLQRLNSDCFTIMQVGLSNQLGEAPLFLGKSGLSAYSTFVREAQVHEQIGDQTVLVEQTTLDKVVEDFSVSRVALAKLDVEGWEIPVLLGALESIKQQKFPLWMIEFTEENASAAGSSTQELASMIEGFGYSLCRFDATQFRLVPEVKRFHYGYENLFAAMDIDTINARLESASLSDKNIAKDIISRWDLAAKAEEARLLIDACQKLSQSLEMSEVDRAARLEQIQTLTSWLKEAGQPYEEIERTEQELERTRQELEKSHQRLDKTQQELDRTHQELELARQELYQTHQRLEQTCQELGQTYQELERISQDFELLRSKALWHKFVRQIGNLVARK